MPFKCKNNKDKTLNRIQNKIIDLYNNYNN